MKILIIVIATIAFILFSATMAVLSLMKRDKKFQDNVEIADLCSFYIKKKPITGMVSKITGDVIEVEDGDFKVYVLDRKDIYPNVYLD